MPITFHLLSGFICLWIWSELLKIEKNKNSLISLLIATALLQVDWLWMSLAGLVFFIFGKNAFRRICLLAALLIGFHFFVQNLSLVTQVQEPDPWIFWLGDTGWRGILLGFFTGFLMKKILREPGHTWWLSPALIVSGIGSLGLVWGLFLGDRQERIDFRSTIFSLVGILAAVFFMSSYDPSLKWQIWLLSCLVWICLEKLIFRRQVSN
jgi:hypothetical protein